MERLFKLGGIIIVIGCVAFLRYDLKEVDVFHNGSINQVKVVFVPKCRSSQAHYAMKFEYKGKVHPKEIGGALCDELKVGDYLPMRMNHDQTIFLFENENPYFDMIGTGILLLFGATLFVFGIRKEKRT